MRYDNTLLGGVVEFCCEGGYQLSGPDTRICQEDCQWSGNGTECISKQQFNPYNNSEYNFVIVSHRAGLYVRLVYLSGYRSLHLRSQLKLHVEIGAYSLLPTRPSFSWVIFLGPVAMDFFIMFFRCFCHLCRLN